MGISILMTLKKLLQGQTSDTVTSDTCTSCKRHDIDHNMDGFQNEWVIGLMSVDTRIDTERLFT